MSRQEDTTVTSIERRALAACMLAWTSASFEFNLFLLVAASVAGTLEFDHGEMTVVLTAALFSSALGGWLAGRFADRLGRLRLFQWAILGLGAAALLTASSLSFETLLLARLLMGVAFGAEWTAGTVLLNECVRPAQRGRYVGFLLSGWGLGWGLAAAVSALAHSIMPAELAWRAAVAVGVLPVGLAWAARRLVSESALFLASRNEDQVRDRPRMWSSSFRLRTFRLCFLAVGVQGGFYALNIWLPTYLRSTGVSAVDTSLLIAFAVVGSITGSILGGWIADLLGRRSALAIGAIGVFGAALVFINVPPFSGFLELALAAAAFLASVTFSALAAVLSESFPTAIRAEAQGFAYNSGRAIAASFPFMIGVLSATIGIQASIALFVGISCFIVVSSAILLPETRGLDLRNVKN